MVGVVGCPVAQAWSAIEETGEHASTVSEMCRSISATGRNYYAQFPAPIELFALARLTRPAAMVESGVSSGVSTTFLLLAASVNRRGVLYSIELPSPRTGRKGDESWAITQGLSSGWAIARALRARWDLRLGSSEQNLPGLLREIGGVDLYCHDSPVSAKHLQFELRAIAGHLNPGFTVVEDNTSLDRAVFEAAARMAGSRALYRKRSSLGAFRVGGR